MKYISRWKFSYRNLLFLLVIVAACWKLNIFSTRKNNNLIEFYNIPPPRIISQRNGMTKSSPKLRLKKRVSDWNYEQSCYFHVWGDICGEKIESLLNYPIFPHLPSGKHRLDVLEFKFLKRNSGFRIFGFLVVPETNEYRFKVHTKHAGTMFFLSKNDLPVDMDLIFTTNYSKDSTVQFGQKTVTLSVQSRYFFDILIKTDNWEYGEFSLHIRNISSQIFHLVDKNYFQSYEINKAEEGSSPYTGFEDKLSILQNVKKSKSDTVSEEYARKRSQSFRIPQLEKEISTNLLETCKYKPSFIIHRKLKYKEGVWETRYMSIYPSDDTDMQFYHTKGNFMQISHGNDIIPEEDVQQVTKDFMEILNSKQKWAYKLQSIVNVERVRDAKNGDRYLLELELKNTKTGNISLFSRYVYQPKGGKRLCYPEGFQSNRDAHVNVIVTVKNQGPWIQHLINTFSEIYMSTNDDKYTLIIVDFNSKDIDLKKALEKSHIPSYVLLHHDGKFYKTFGLQEAASHVTDPNDIVLQIDLHLTIPLDFLHLVRKHTVKGKAAFCPSVFRLECGYTPQNPNGFWETSGYGIFSVYKSDWDIFGGMNVKKFYNKWGGEDWEMLDRFLSAGYEVERLKLKNFNHVYHSKAGMWQNVKK